MKKLLMSLMVILMMLACKKEANTVQNEVQESTPLATPVLKEEKTIETQIIDSELFSGAAFEANIPIGFIAKPSMGSGANFNQYDSYFFSSPDDLVQFYAYSSPTKKIPNDIVFPNEKIEKKVSQSSDTLIIQWQLPKNKQTGYFRSFTEKSFDTGLIITGYFFKDDAAYAKYENELKEFENSLKLKIKD